MSSDAFFPQRDCIDTIAEKGVTDIVLYGDTRPVHATAIRLARARGLCIHVFEEGELRPWWVTYRNDRTPPPDLPMRDIRRYLADRSGRPAEAPEGWGALTRHMVYGALYHAALLAGGQRIAPHRDVPVAREAALHLKRLFRLPTAQRPLRTRGLG